VKVDDQPVLGHVGGSDPLAGNATGVYIENRYVNSGRQFTKGPVKDGTGLVDVSGRLRPNGLHDADDVVKFR
jgi:hypothetical protein